jgi:hypothetical protein
MDPRLAPGPAAAVPLVPIDPRVGRTVLKALGRRRAPAPPSMAGHAETERPFWGPHWDPDVSAIEEAFYGWGQRFLTDLLSAALGKRVRPRTLLKAEVVALPGPSEPSGWGKVLSLFKGGGSPPEILDGWTKVIDSLVAKLVPAGNAQAAAQGLAFRSHLLYKIGEKVSQGPEACPVWSDALAGASPAQVQSMEWTQVRALEFCTALTDNARHTMRQALITSKEAGEGPQALQRRLFDQFGAMNRDWRRIALTETAMAVQNGILSSVDPKEGWLAEWHAAPNACPYCLQQHRKRFRVVDKDAPGKDGNTQMWVGKNNIGRSAHRWSKKEGRWRERFEMWWPCVPVHPNCACLLVLRRNQF